MMEGRTGKIKNVLGRVEHLVAHARHPAGRHRAGDGVDQRAQQDPHCREEDHRRRPRRGRRPPSRCCAGSTTSWSRCSRELDKLGVVGTRRDQRDQGRPRGRAPPPRADPPQRRQRRREQSSAPNCQGCETLVPGLVAAQATRSRSTLADTIHGDFANVVFKMQIKLTPVSEGGLLPTTLQDLEHVVPLDYRSRPICSPVGDAIDQLCALARRVADVRRDGQRRARPRRGSAGIRPTDRRRPCQTS